ncbi:MAG: tetratricopeptide repeat-containing sensor histidine kinase [Reichenbachiella sp.]
MNRFKYLFAISYGICMLISSHLYAHTPQNTIDSLKVYLTMSNDTVQVQINNQIAWNFRNINSDSSFYYAQKSHLIAKALKYSNGIAQGLNFMGIAMRNQSRYHEAMNYFFEALKIAELTVNSEQISYTLINIGNICLYQANFEGAFQYFNRSLNYSKELSNLRLEAYSHINLGRAYEGLKEYNKAKTHVVKAIRIRESLQDQEGLAISNLDLASLYLLLDRPDSALIIVNRNLELVKKLGHKNTLAFCYITLSEIHLQEQRLNTAYRSIQKSLAVSTSHQLKNAEVEGLKILAEIYEQQNLSKKALKTYKKYLCNKDSIYNAENTRKIADIFSKYTFEKSEIEKLSLKAKTDLNELVIKRQRVIIILSVILTVSFLIITIVAYKSSLERKRLNKQIRVQKDTAFQHNNELIDINNEKNNLIRILSHDLRAPINNIKGLTQVHQMDHENDFSESENEILNLIKSESDRLLNMIKKILNVEAMENDSNDVEFEKVDITKVGKDLVASFLNTAVSKDIQIKATLLTDAVYVLGDSIHLHQIMENLLSNAIKFTGKGKNVSIGMSSKNNKVNIKFKDEGPGLTKTDEENIFKKFQTLSAKPTANEESTGLGLSIVKKYVEEMNGKVWYESKLGKGTTFIIEFDQVSPPTT